MPSTLRASLAILLLAAGPAHAQRWKDAYETGDIFRALDMLQPLVFEADPRHHEPAVDPMAALYLATYYVNGWRVEKDPVMACGLTLAARRAAAVQGRYPEPMNDALKALERKTCAVITHEQRLDASLIPSCPNIGLAGQIVELGNGSRVEITRKDFIVDQPGRRTETGVAMPCAQHVLPARHASLVPPPGAAGHARQIIELFAWHSGVVNGERRRHLRWTAWDVVDGMVELSGDELVADEAGSAWPVRPVPEGVRFDFRFKPNGEVEYEFTNAAGKRKRGELRQYDELVKAATRRPH